MAADRHTYQIAWNWRDEAGSRPRHDDLEATTAETAIRKLRKQLREEYSITNRDVVIQEVYRI